MKTNNKTLNKAIQAIIFLVAFTGIAFAQGNTNFITILNADVPNDSSGLWVDYQLDSFDTSWYMQVTVQDVNGNLLKQEKINFILYYDKPFVESDETKMKQIIREHKCFYVCNTLGPRRINQLKISLVIYDSNGDIIGQAEYN